MLVNGDDVIGVVVGFEVENERRETEHAQSGGREDRAFQAGSGLLLQNFAGRSRGQVQVIRQVIEIGLNPPRRFQAPERAQFRRGPGGMECRRNYNPVGWRASNPEGLRAVGCQRGAQRSCPVM